MCHTDQPTLSWALLSTCEEDEVLRFTVFVAEPKSWFCCFLPFVFHPKTQRTTKLNSFRLDKCFYWVHPEKNSQSLFPLGHADWRLKCDLYCQVGSSNFELVAESSFEARLWTLCKSEDELLCPVVLCIFVHILYIFSKPSTHPRARPTTSFFSSQFWPGLYSPLSSTALLSPLVKNLMSPFSLDTKNKCDFKPQQTTQDECDSTNAILYEW